LHTREGGVVGIMSTSGEGNEGLTLEKCAECNEEVKSADKAIDCDICKKWVHIKCGKVSNLLYGELKKAASGTTLCLGVKFLCTKCDKIFVSLKIDIKRMMERQNEMERKQEGLAESLKVVKEEVIEIRESLKKIEMMKSNAEESTKGNVAEEIGDLKEQLGELKLMYSDVTRVEGAEGGIVIRPQQESTARKIQLEVSEVMEREKRKNNLVIFGIEETDDENVTKNRVEAIITEVGVDISKVKYFGRVGKRTQVTGGRARIVRVVCEDLETRRSVLKGANKLKVATGYERTYIAPDLTKSQQDLDKKLRDSLKVIREQHKDAKINNGEIIKIVGGTRMVLVARLEN